MGKRLYPGLILALILFFCACTDVSVEGDDTTPPTYEAPTIVAADDVEASPATVVPETTVPSHSELYLPEYTPQQILEYFEEVVLHMEYTDGTGDASLVQKWLAPIHYRIYGDPTEEDLAVLSACFEQLNEIPGFPGIYVAADDEPGNLTINFLEPEDFHATFSTLLNGEYAYGATQFWYYTATNEIHTANVGYRTDIDQATRTSILIEEIVNMLGISDTVLRTDSIVYQYSNENTALSEVDLVILKLLYDPAIQCGMDVESCSAVVLELYY